MKFIAKTFAGLEEILEDELKKIGATETKKLLRAVAFEGDLELMYKANIRLRTASRILLEIKSFGAKNADTIYEQAKSIEWDKLFDINQTFVVNATIYSETFVNSQFVSYKVKDAIADYFSEKFSRRPSVSLTSPDIYVNVYIAENSCSISLDSSGESLHKRGYREEKMKAPMNEALAAGLLLLAGWKGQSNLIDVMCGSGTLLIEAALIACNIPPGIFRENYAFKNWQNFDEAIFEQTINDESLDRQFDYKIYGYDISQLAIEKTRANIKKTGLGKYIELKHCALADFKPEVDNAIIVTNPPYGKRLQVKDLDKIYETFGTVLKHRCSGMQAWIISSNVVALRKIGLKPSKKIAVMNGQLECEYCRFDIFDGKRKDFLRENNGR